MSVPPANQSTVSPSDFARTDVARYGTWASSTNILLNRTVPPEIRKECDSLAELVVPHNLLSTLAAVIAHPNDKHQKVFADDLLRYFRNLNFKSTDAADINEMVHNWTSIARAHEKISECDQDTNEATLRKGINELLYLSRGGSGAKILFEMSVRLRASTAARIPSPITTADIIIVHPMPPSLEQALCSGEIEFGVAAHALWRDPVILEAKFMDFLMSAAEYKLATEQAAYRQLVYDLSTAQSVRRTLGLSDIILYGWTSLKEPLYNHVYMLLYACWWSKDKIHFSKKLQSFDLSDALSCLTFYNFLCNLNNRNAAIVRTDRDKDFKDVVILLMNGQWRAPDVDRKRQDNERHNQNPPPAQRGAPAPGDTMQESDFEDSLSDGVSDMSNDFPTTEENLREMNQILGNYGEDKQHHGRVFGTTMDWIEKFVSKTNWAERFLAHSDEDSILTDDDFLLEVPHIKTIMF